VIDEHLDFSLMYGKELSRIFRIHIARFQRLVEDVMATGIKFHQPKTNRPPTNQASLEAKLTLPLPVLGVWNPSNCCGTLLPNVLYHGLEYCTQFDQTIRLLYMEEYLRLPTPSDTTALIN
jgi:hypothetical protein